MRYDKATILCFSPTRTSATVAEAVVRGMECGAEWADLTYPGIGTVDVHGAAVIAVPVYGGRVAETAAERLRQVKGNGSPAVLVVLYGNRDYEDALLELRDLAVEQGFVPVAGGAFIGEHSYSRPPERPIAAGRPDTADLAVAEAFGRQVAEKLARYASPERLPALSVKGNFPYKEKKRPTPAAPVTVEELCTQCGTCIDLCPVDAIALKGEIVSDAALCIKCCACVKFCPSQARRFDTPYTDMLFRNFSARREPECFL